MPTYIKQQTIVEIADHINQYAMALEILETLETSGFKVSPENGITVVNDLHNSEFNEAIKSSVKALGQRDQLTKERKE